jgi:hypothetical protein
MQSPIPVSPVIDPGSARLQKLAGGDHRGMTNDANQAALARALKRSTQKPCSVLWKVTRSPARTPVELAVDQLGSANAINLEVVIFTARALSAHGAGCVGFSSP